MARSPGFFVLFYGYLLVGNFIYNRTATGFTTILAIIAAIMAIQFPPALEVGTTKFADFGMHIIILVPTSASATST